jgi:hypothetical protein
MSIFSAWRNGKIGWPQAVIQAEAYVGAFINHTPAVKALIDDEVTVFKQAASNAIAMIDSAAPGVIDASATVVANEAKVLLTAYIGVPGEVIVGPGILDAVNIARDTLIAEVHAAALQFKADLAAAAPAIPGALKAA